MKRSLFISYRRGDSAGTAGRLRDMLESRIRRVTFMDVSDIGAGEDFMAKIEGVLGESGVALIVIGPKWKGEESDKRLGDPGDYVTKELRLSLDKGVPIIPILVDGAHMPAPADLPDDLRKIATLNAVEVRHSSFERDVDHLATLLYEKLNVPPPNKVERWMQALYPYPLDWMRTWCSFAGFRAGFIALGFALIEWFEPPPQPGSWPLGTKTVGVEGYEVSMGTFFALLL